MNSFSTYLYTVNVFFGVPVEQGPGHVMVFSRKWAFSALQAGKIPKKKKLAKLSNFWRVFFHVFMAKKCFYSNFQYMLASALKFFEKYIIILIDVNKAYFYTAKIG